MTARVEHVDACAFGRGVLAAAGALMLFGGDMYCTCPPAHRRAERRRVRRALVAEAAK